MGLTAVASRGVGRGDEALDGRVGGGRLPELCGGWCGQRGGSRGRCGWSLQRGRKIARTNGRSAANRSKIWRDSMARVTERSPRRADGPGDHGNEVRRSRGRTGRMLQKDPVPARSRLALAGAAGRGGIPLHHRDSDREVALQKQSLAQPKRNIATSESGMAISKSDSANSDCGIAIPR